MFNAFTFWDVLEHVENPESYFGWMRDGAVVFVSLPVFDDLNQVRASKHYRPNEHFIIGPFAASSNGCCSMASACSK